MRARASRRGAPATTRCVAARSRTGPLRLSTLARASGRDPQAARGAAARAGVVAVEQELGAPGFREVQRRRAAATPPFEPQGRAQAEVLDAAARGRRARARGRPRRDRPSLRGAVDRLAEKGALRIEDERDARGARGRCRGRDDGAVTPTADQEAALRACSRRGRERRLPAVPAPRRHRQRQDRGLLPRRRGGARARTRGAILLVPEIALTPMLRARRARRASATTVAVLHSELSAGERHDQWWRIREGEARVVVGARSAVFAPVRRARAWSSSTRSTRAPTSRTRARATTRATSR